MLASTRKATMQMVLLGDNDGICNARLTNRRGVIAGMLLFTLGAVVLGSVACSTPAPNRKAAEPVDAASTSVVEGASDVKSTIAAGVTSSGDTLPSPNTSDPFTTAHAETTSVGDDRDVVRGRVIDYWGHAMVGVAVGIGEERTKTDEQGQFTFRDVGPTYDVSAVVRFSGDIAEVYGWRYEGLTRRDPTLQVYKGLRQRETQVTFEVTGLGAESVYAEAGLGGVHGQRSYSVASTNEALTAWRGSDSIDAVVHAVSFEAPQGPRIPATYLAHATSTVTLTDHGSTPIALNLASTGDLPAANIWGSALAPREADRVHLVFARFGDGPSLLLVSEPRAAESDTAFEYLAPVIDDMTLTVAVREDARVAQGEYSIGYVSGVMPGQDVGVIGLSVPPRMHEPLEGAVDVTKDTIFDWETESGTSVVVFEDQQVFQAVYVVTANKQVSLPDLSGLGVFYSNHGVYTWAVESHGTSSSVDELTNEQGFLDPFSGDHNYPMGLNKGQGRYSRSGTLMFTTGKVTDSPFAR